MTTIYRRRRLSEPADPERRHLRFVDGLTVDPADCPRHIHARKHWTADGCLCGDPTDQFTPPQAA